MKLTMTQIVTDIQSLKTMYEKSLLQIQETTNVILAKINSAQYYKEDNTITQDHEIRQYLPLNSIQKLLDFEDILKNSQEASMQIVNNIL